MPDAHYEVARLAELYDLDSPWSVDRDFYAALAGDRPKRVLDLGCGTGLICHAYAEQGHAVTGVDLSGPMLDVARGRDRRVTWVHAPAQTFRSKDRYDVIIMTGHAFQVFLNEADVLAVFETVRRHLAPDGLFAFESRNPRFDWEKAWNTQAVVTNGTFGVHQSRHVTAVEDGFLSFETRYRFPDETLVSESRLRFMMYEEIEACLARSGLRAGPILGDWDRTPFDENRSQEMIFLVHHQTGDSAEAACA